MAKQAPIKYELESAGEKHCFLTIGDVKIKITHAEGEQWEAQIPDSQACINIEAQIPDGEACVDLDRHTVSEKEQVEDLGETLTNAIKEMPEGYKLKCHRVMAGGRAILDAQVIPNEQEFNVVMYATESPDKARRTIIVNPAEWDEDIIDCPFADQDSICLRAATEGMSVEYCVHRGEPCLDKCPLEDGPVEVSLAASN